MAQHGTPALPDLQLRNSTLKATLRRKSTHGLIEMDAEQLAAVVLDEAFIAMGWTNKSIGADLHINESVVGRWRAPHAREWPSHVQMVKLGQLSNGEFLRLIHRGFARRYGWGRKALLDLVSAVEDLAEAMEA